MVCLGADGCSAVFLHFQASSLAANWLVIFEKKDFFAEKAL
jgi:hypothetical protein